MTRSRGDRVFRRIVLPVLALWLVVSCSAPAPTIAAESAASPTAAATPSERAAVVVVFLGDSLTAGYELELDQALPEQIQKRWQAQHLNAAAINAGVSGDTTANGLARFDWSVMSAEPDLVVIALGANDYLMGIPPEQTRQNLAAIIDKANAAGIRSVLVGLRVRGDTQPGSREEAFGQIYADLAKAYNVPLFPDFLQGVWDNPSLLQEDGLHPTSAGVELVADRLSAFLEPYLVDAQP